MTTPPPPARIIPCSWQKRCCIVCSHICPAWTTGKYHDFAAGKWWENQFLVGPAGANIVAFFIDVPCTLDP